MFAEIANRFSEATYFVAGILAVAAMIFYLPRGSVKASGVEMPAQSKFGAYFTVLLATLALSIGIAVEAFRYFGSH